NPIIPLIDTAKDVINVPKSNIYLLVFSISTPRLFADSSPVNMIFRSLAKKLITIIERIKGIEVLSIGSQPLPDKLPKVQYIIFVIALSSNIIKKDIIAVKNWPTAIPANNSVVTGT